MNKQFKIIVEKHPDGYVAYPLGLKGVVVSEGVTSEEALINIQSAIQFHVTTFGKDAFWEKGMLPLREEWAMKQLTEGEKQIIDERLESYHLNPELGSPWEEVFERINLKDIVVRKVENFTPLKRKEIYDQ